MEQKIQTLTNDNTKRIADVFDLIAGTSTGGILTCLYLCPDGNKQPKFSALDAVNLYLQNGDDIFDVSVFKQITSLVGIADEKYNTTFLQEYSFDPSETFPTPRFEARGQLFEQTILLDSSAGKLSYTGSFTTITNYFRTSVWQ